jgi:hypothetical protein
MRKFLSFLMTVALIAVPLSRILRRSEQRRVLARLKQLGWGLGESEKLYNDYYSHWPSRG